MLDSTIIEVAVGVIFIFFVASIVADAINEMVAGFFKWHATELDEGLRVLLGSVKGDPRKDSGSLYEKVLEHPLIRDLGRPDWLRRIRKARGPSYIPAPTFGRALLDVLFPDSGRAPGSGGLEEELRPSGDKRSSCEADIPDQVMESLLTIMRDAGDDAERFRAGVEAWYDDLMDRVSGWYGRKTRTWLVVWGLLLAIALNIDMVAITDSLWTDETVRETVVAAAATRLEAPEAEGTAPSDGSDAPAEETAAEPLSADAIAEELEALEELDLPIGWTGSDGGFRLPDDPAGWVARILSWSIVAAAASFGAPFWFDLLGKVSNLRLAGKKPQSSVPGDGPPSVELKLTTGPGDPAG